MQTNISTTAAPTVLRARSYSKAEMIARSADGFLSKGYERYIPLDRIDGLEPVPANNESDDGEYHAGRPVTQPIEVQYDPDLDVYMLYGGNHRIAQARANGDEYILAFVEPARVDGRDFIGTYALRRLTEASTDVQREPEYTTQSALSSSLSPN